VPYGVKEANGFTSLRLLRHEQWTKRAEDEHKKENDKLFQIGSIMYLYENSDKGGLFKEIVSPLPRAYFVCSWINANNKTQILDQLSSEKFNPFRSAIVENFKLQPVSNEGTECFKEVKLTKDDSENIELSLNAPSDGFVVITDSYYPQWKALVNKKPSKIYPINYLFRSVYVEKGENLIEFYYETKYINLLVMLSWLFTIISIIMFGRYAKNVYN